MITVILAVSLCACGGDDAVTMVIPIKSDPMCIDPQIVETESGKIIVANCYEGLVRLDENYGIVSGVAESWEISSDGLKYTFRLRKDAVWQRLEKAHEKILPEEFDVGVTAYDFQFALRRALDPMTKCDDAEKFFCIKNAAAINGGEAVPAALGVEVTDKFTLVITLERANPDFLRLLTLPAAMPCNESFFNLTHAKYGLDLSYTLCNGPFYLSRWAADNTLVMRKTVGYKGENESKTDAVYFYVNSDSDSVVSKFRQHSYDCIFTDNETKKDLSDLKNVSYLETVNTVSGLCFNCGENVLFNADVRKALLCAFKAENLTLPEGAKSTATGIVPDCCRFAESSYRDCAGVVKLPEYDEKSARELMAKGLKEMAIESMELKVICTKELTVQMQTLIQDWQRVFGTSIVAKVETLSDADFTKALKNGTYQIAAGSVCAETSTAADVLKSFMSGASGNIFNYSDEKYDELIDGILTTASGDDIIKEYRAAEQMLVSDAVFCPLFTYSKSAAVNGDVTGLYALPVLEGILFTNGGKK